ncbi:hypothetical protein BH10ACI3_BH10ACI3_09730 [soil metagenome]
MSKALRVLNIEDSERDVVLLTRHLIAAGYEPYSERVETANSMNAALQAGEWDIILCDYSMPNFNALLALKVLRASGLDIPFIIISGTVGEEVAVQAMLTGAHDYLPKDNLTRLVPAIKREMLQAENRRAKRETEMALKASEAEMRALFAAMKDVILVLDYEGRHLKVAPTNPAHTYSRGTYRIGKTVHKIFPAAIADFILANVKRSLDEGRTLNVEYTVPIDGKELWFDGTVTPMTDDSVVWVARDITSRKHAEIERRVMSDIIQAAAITPNLEEFLKLVHRSISEIIYAENCIVMLYDPATDTFEYDFWADERDLPVGPRPVGKGFGSYVLRTGRPLLLTKQRKKELVDLGEATLAGTPSRSWLGVPLHTPTGTIGVMVVQHYEIENAYDEHDLEFLSSVGDQIALVIERKRAEDAVRISEEQYRDLVENAIDIIYSHDLNGNYTSANKAAETITGYTNAEILAMNMADSMPAGQLEKAKAMIAAKLAGEDVTAYEIELLAKDGHAIQVEVNTRIIHKDGIPIGVQGIARDITERKRAETQLRLQSTVLEAAANAMVITDPDGTIDWVNQAFTKLTGYAPSEAIGQNPRILKSGEVAADVYKTLWKTILSGQPWTGEMINRRKDGKHYIEEQIITPVMDTAGKITNFIAIKQNVTERKRGEEDLNESQRLIEGIINSIPVRVFWKDKDLVYLGCNAAFALDAGFADPEDIIGKDDFQMGWREQAESFRADDRRVIEDGIAKLLIEESQTTPDGDTITLLTSKLPLRDSAGKISGVLGTYVDITDRKKAEVAIRDSEERFSSAFEFAPIGVALVSPDGHWLKVNRALCDLVGYTEAEMLTSNFQEITHADDLEHDLENMRRVIAGDITSYQIEKRYVHKLGHYVPTLLNVSLVRDTGGKPRYFISQIQDITKRKELEEQNRHSQKMEAVGVLAGGIAHDFNNLLTAINGYSDLTLRKMQADDPLRHNVEEVKKAGDRAAELTSQLLAFSRKQVLKPMVHSLNLVIENLQNMLRRIIREDIDLRTVLDPALGNIKADPGQIEQVIMNLAVNARDAMPHGGTLTIESQNVYLDDEYVSQHLTIAPGAFVRLTVTDTGEGMEESVKQHIFEPFYTTKEVGKGTGLGLSMVYGVVKQSGGDIMVYSEPGHGTTFKIYLPCVDEIVQKPRWTGERKQLYSGTETVLLVEDEEVVRNLVREILAENGYKVLEASSGKEALKLCSSYEGPIHLLLSDVIMPKMGGSELKDEVVKMLPDIKTLFMSGYTDDALAHRGVFDADIAFIEKPFTPDALSRKVREVLEY